MKITKLVTTLGFGFEIFLSGCNYGKWEKNNYAISWNDSIDAYGKIVDNRDNQVYRTVKIGNQTWMAENLNYTPAGSDSTWCFNNSKDSCGKYGRLYTWTSINSVPTKTEGSKNTSGICPQGWHVPSDADWGDLIDMVEGHQFVGTNKGGRALKSRTGWVAKVGELGDRNGEKYPDFDYFGFRALPGGTRNDRGEFFGSGNLGRWWSATDYRPGTGASTVAMVVNYPNVNPSIREYSSGLSVRCMKN